MANKLFTFLLQDSNEAREKAHAALAELVAGGTYPNAECREDNGQGVYEVWDGPEPVQASVPPPKKPEGKDDMTADELVDKVADAVVDKLVALGFVKS